MSPLIYDSLTLEHLSFEFLNLKILNRDNVQLNATDSQNSCLKIIDKIFKIQSSTLLQQKSFM